jgi:S1-C subfamily serine protease
MELDSLDLGSNLSNVLSSFESNEWVNQLNKKIGEALKNVKKSLVEAIDQNKWSNLCACSSEKTFLNYITKKLNPISGEQAIQTLNHEIISCNKTFQTNSDLETCIVSLFDKKVINPLNDLAKHFRGETQTTAESEKNQSNSLSMEELKIKAHKISIKIVPGGSGFIFAKKNNVYRVATNYHVTHWNMPEGKCRLKTFDENEHICHIVLDGIKDFGKKDLSVIEFTSNNSYPLAALGDASDLKIGVPIISVGFPGTDGIVTGKVTDGKIVFHEGKITLFTKKTFGTLDAKNFLPKDGGYSVGYQANVINGMSGGPVLNRKGKVIAINGISSYPLAPRYGYDDGSGLLDSVELEKHDWGISIQTFLDALNGVTNFQSPSPTPGNSSENDDVVGW